MSNLQQLSDRVTALENETSTEVEARVARNDEKKAKQDAKNAKKAAAVEQE